MGILKVTAKCSDLCVCQYYNDKSEKLIESDGYVPENINIGGPDDDGDYIDIEIDAKTSQILNWKPVSEKQMIKEIETMLIGLMNVAKNNIILDLSNVVFIDSSGFAMLHKLKIKSYLDDVLIKYINISAELEDLMNFINYN